MVSQKERNAQSEYGFLKVESEEDLEVWKAAQPHSRSVAAFHTPKSPIGKAIAERIIPEASWEEF
jgi:hypothetical protein